MSTTITQGAETITPLLVDRYESTSASRNNVHDVLGASAPDVTLRPGGLRRGQLSMVFASPSSGGYYDIVDGYIVWVDGADSDAEADSLAAEELHRAGGVFTVADPDVTSINMDYVVDGSITRTLNDVRTVWTVTVDFQEVPA